jgi:hypothetical protein
MKPGIYKIVIDDDKTSLKGPIEKPANDILCVYVFQKELEGCWIARYNSKESFFTIIKQIELKAYANWEKTILEEIEKCQINMI